MKQAIVMGPTVAPGAPAMLLPRQKSGLSARGYALGMTARYALADVAALVGEPTRAAILLALLDGRALPAGELAMEAGISAAATSLHLAKLTRGGLLLVQREGRHRYYRLASADVGHALEALGVIATSRPPARALTRERAALRAARSCYDHLAGALAVALAEKMARDRAIVAAGERSFEITPRGAGWLADVMGIDVSMLATGRRPLARRCLDWTERRPHVAGALGAALLEHVLAARWVARVEGTRALRVTPRGREALTRLGVGEALEAGAPVGVRARIDRWDPARY
jgi:DNA-binding transcriptional ArsR family regulator